MCVCVRYELNENEIDGSVGLSHWSSAPLPLFSLLPPTEAPAPHVLPPLTPLRASGTTWAPRRWPRARRKRTFPPAIAVSSLALVEPGRSERFLPACARARRPRPGSEIRVSSYYMDRQCPTCRTGEWDFDFGRTRGRMVLRAPGGRWHAHGATRAFFLVIHTFPRSHLPDRKSVV